MNKEIGLGFVHGEKSRHSESDLFAPTLLILAQAQVQNNGPVSTRQLREALEKSLPLGEEDMAPLKNRSDTKFSQVVRNLRSNRTMEKLGLVDYDEEKCLWSITNVGRAALFRSMVETFGPILTMAEENTPRKALVEKKIRPS